MVLEPSLCSVPSEATVPVQPDKDNDFWYGLINEKLAASFLDLSVRTLQGLRCRGGGPRFVRISGRCIKYRRIDLRDWGETNLRTSTSDAGPEAA